MSSAEVFCWGELAPAPGEESPGPIEAGRGSLVRRVYAGVGSAVLAGAESVKWTPRSRPRPDCTTDSSTANDGGGDGDGDGDDGGGSDHGDLWGLPGVECVALAQDHTLLLRRVVSGERRDDDDVGGETQVLVWGSGRQGQLGLGSRTLESKTPTPIPALSAYRVVQVACGAHHSAAVTSHGDLFTWGRGIEGQLGLSSPHLPTELNEAITGVQFRPRPVPAFLATKKRCRPVAGVSCGHNFTVVVTRVGEVWAFGEGSAGQIGVGRITKAPVPTVVMPACPATGEPFVEVAAGWAHALARTKGGGVFSWGFNAMGSLGLGDHQTRFFPEAVTLRGDWHEGSGPGDRCGGPSGPSGPRGSEVNVISDGKKGRTAVKINACGHCSGALTTEGELLTWGCHSAGRLGYSYGGSCGRPEGMEYVPRPRRVDRLAGAELTDFALSGGGGVALIPLRVKSIYPASGPLETGCKVVIHGCGFWDSPDIVVKFTPVARGARPVAARSAVGTYVARSEAGADGGELGDSGGIERVTCVAPCFASPEEVKVEVSVDGVSFTTDGTKFQYYRKPEIVQITPSTCRPPFPRLRLDGTHITPCETLLVRFVEEGGGRHEADGDVELKASPDSDGGASTLSTGPASRIITVAGRTESETFEVDIDPDTDLPIFETRWFVTCDSPSLLPPQAKLPFISRVTVAPNGANFEGEPLRFIAHDPLADACLPTAVPVSDTDTVPAPTPALADCDEERNAAATAAAAAAAAGELITITGRNLYRGAGLAVRLRFDSDDGSSSSGGGGGDSGDGGGSGGGGGDGCGGGGGGDSSGDEDSVIPLHAVAFDDATETVTGRLPAAAASLLAGPTGTATKGAPRPPALGVAVEVTVDGKEYFAAPERLTLYRHPNLTLKGDGLYPVAGGGWVELAVAEPTFRGHEAKVRLVSVEDGVDVTLPLLSSRPPDEAEATAGQPPDAAAPSEKEKEEEKEKGGLKAAVGPPSSGDASNKKPLAAQNDGGKELKPPDAQARHGGGGGGSTEEEAAPEEENGCKGREVAVSSESFFFAVPPLPKQQVQGGGPAGDCTGDGSITSGGGNVDDDRRKETAVATASDRAKKAPPPTASPAPTGKAAQGASRGGPPPEPDEAAVAAAAVAAARENACCSLSVLVSLNGTAWRPAAGPPLVYFNPPPEPVLAPPPVETKGGRGKKK